MVHELKTWPKFFDSVKDGTKTFEIRKDDRGYEVGDTLRLWRYDPESKHFSGDCIDVAVTYILHGPAFGIEEGFCVMGFAIKHPRMPSDEEIREAIYDVTEGDIDNIKALFERCLRGE